jgi:hypothetical protein
MSGRDCERVGTMTALTDHALTLNPSRAAGGTRRKVARSSQGRGGVLRDHDLKITPFPVQNSGDVTVGARPMAQPEREFLLLICCRCSKE